MFCSKFVDHIPKIRQTKPEKLKQGLKFDIGQLRSEPFNCPHVLTEVLGTALSN